MKGQGPSRWRLAVLLLVFFIPSCWLLYLAFLDPEIEMLPPGRGTWVMDGRWKIFTGPSFPSILYRLQLGAMEPPPASLPVAVTVLGEFKLAINGRLRFDSSKQSRRWRRPVELDLAPWLDRGPNLLLIEVRNAAGPPPLRVSWPSTRAGPRLPATGEGGWEATIPEIGWQPVVAAGRGEAWLQDKDWTWPQPELYALLLIAIAALVAVASWRARRSVAPLPVTGGLLRRRGPELAVLGLIAAINFWNAANYPYNYSRLDAWAHADRVRYQATTLRTPLAEEGWMFYQPPLYYWIAGAVHRVAGSEAGDSEEMRPLQWLDALWATAHAGVAYLVLGVLGPPSRRARAFALMATGLSAVALTTTPMLGNETFNGLMCGLPLAVGALLFARGRPGLGAGSLLGLLAALGMLTKFTGLISAAALAVVLGTGFLEATSAPARRRRLAALAALALVTALVAGPFYARNVRVYGKPFVGNWDPESGFSKEEKPGYRTLPFYLSFGEVFFHVPERGMWSSLWDGLYASTWSEINDSFLSVDDPSTLAQSSFLLVFALLPTAAAAVGFVRTLRRARTDARGVDLLLVTVTVFSLAALVGFTMRVPFNTTVKSIYLLFLIVPASLFAARGYAFFERGLGRARWLLDVGAFYLLVLTVRLFVWL